MERKHSAASSTRHAQPRRQRRWVPLWRRRGSQPQPDVGDARTGSGSSLKWVAISMGLCALAIIWVRGLGDLETAYANIFTLIFGFLALASIAVWFFLFSGYARRTRGQAFKAGLVTLAVMAATLRIDGVWGGLFPVVRWRWQPKTDALIAPAQGLTSAGRIDLTTTGPDDYPQFLGPHRDLTLEHVRLDRDWQAHPPQLVWKQPIGAGWSSFAVVGQSAVTMEQRGEQELVTCYDLPTGKLHWAQAVATRHETTLGGVGPRSTPTIHQGKIYALGATGILRCLDGATGKLLWTRNLLAEFGIQGPQQDMEAISWGRAGSPLVVDNRVIVPAGGPKTGPYVSLVAYDKNTGHEIWRGGQRQIGFSSPTLATLAGQPQILITNEDTVAGHDLESGRELWHVDWPGRSNANASNSQPIVIANDRVLISKGYGGGAMVFEVSRRQDVWGVKEIWRDSKMLQTKLTNLAIRDGFAYALSDVILECVALDSGKRQWKRGRYGYGQVLLVGDLLLVVAESGEVALVEATASAYHELGRFQALEGVTWNNPALSGSMLLVRNAEQAACYRLPLTETPQAITTK